MDYSEMLVGEGFGRHGLQDLDMVFTFTASFVNQGTGLTGQAQMT